MSKKWVGDLDDGKEKGMRKDSEGLKLAKRLDWMRINDKPDFAQWENVLNHTLTKAREEERGICIEAAELEELPEQEDSEDDDRAFYNGGIIDSVKAIRSLGPTSDLEARVRLDTVEKVKEKGILRHNDDDFLTYTILWNDLDAIARGEG